MYQKITYKPEGTKRVKSFIAKSVSDCVLFGVDHITAVNIETLNPHLITKSLIISVEDVIENKTYCEWEVIKQQKG